MLNRNVLYLVISVLAVAAVVFGYQLYQVWASVVFSCERLINSATFF